MVAPLDLNHPRRVPSFRAAAEPSPVAVAAAVVVVVVVVAVFVIAAVVVVAVVVAGAAGQQSRFRCCCNQGRSMAREAAVWPHEIALCRLPA